jgi:hypothetical protein
LLLQEPDAGQLPRELGGLSPLEWTLEGLRQALTGPAFFVAIAMIGVGGSPAGRAFRSARRSPRHS